MIFLQTKFEELLLQQNVPPSFYFSGGSQKMWKQEKTPYLPSAGLNFFPPPLLPAFLLPGLLASNFCTGWLFWLGLGNQVGSAIDHLANCYLPLNIFRTEFEGGCRYCALYLEAILSKQQPPKEFCWELRSKSSCYWQWQSFGWVAISSDSLGFMQCWCHESWLLALI